VSRSFLLKYSTVLWSWL